MKNICNKKELLRYKTRKHVDAAQNAPLRIYVRDINIIFRNNSI